MNSDLNVKTTQSDCYTYVAIIDLYCLAILYKLFDSSVVTLPLCFGASPICSVSLQLFQLIIIFSSFFVFLFVGVTFTLKDHESNSPESVPLIIKSKILNSLLTDTDVQIEEIVDYSDPFQNMNGGKKSNSNITQKSKIEFRIKHNKKKHMNLN